MSRQPLPRPGLTNEIAPSAGGFATQPEKPKFETDLADLASRFSAQSGGGLSHELSADLALEIVLNEIVEQACLATGATGAAIALQKDGEMVCRASNGATAPELGARLDTSSGLSGECVKTRRMQRCDDALTDPRADVEASERLGVRSVMVMPLITGSEFGGVFELLSSRPSAFGERDERTLEALAERTLANLERATHLEAMNEIPAERVEPSQEVLSLAMELARPPVAKDDTGESLGEVAAPEVPARGFELATWILGVIVAACAILLGVLVGRHLGPPNLVGRVRSVVTSSLASPVPGNASGAQASPPASAQPPAPGKPNVSGGVPPGGLLVSENGKEVFRLMPSSSGSLGKVVELSPSAAEDSLISRVEPEYPDEARQQNIQGAVVLQVHITADGRVQDMQLVSGPPQLVQASVDAVKQWRFKPRLVQGRPAEMQTQVTLNFRLPQ